MERRITRSANLVLNASVEDVFPLFGAIEEKKWAPGWELNVISHTDAEIEEGMVFTTESTFDDESSLIWIVSLLDSSNYRIRYTIYGLARIWTIDIKCESEGNETKAEVTYTFTGIDETGCEKNIHHLDRIFTRNLADWEELINNYLLSKEILAV